MSPRKPAGSPTIEQTVEQFLWRAEARGLTFKTLGFYRDCLTRILLPWCGREGLTTIDQLDQAVLDRLAINLQRHTTKRGTSLSKATQRSYLRAVGALLSWARDQGLVQDVRVPLPALRRMHRDVLSRREIEILELSASNERDRLMIRILGDTGCREGELANLRLTDIVNRSGTMFLLLRGKTGSREAPLAPEVADRLLAYRNHARPKSRSDALFLGRHRRPGAGYEALGDTGVYQAVRSAAHVANLGRRVYPHLLRHSALTHMVSRGLHPALVSQVTGVSVQVIASNYSHPSSAQVAAAVLGALAEDSA